DHVPADGLRRRGRAAARRDHRPLGAAAERDEAAGRAKLVLPELAQLDAAASDRGSGRRDSYVAVVETLTPGGRLRRPPPPFPAGMRGPRAPADGLRSSAAAGAS